MAEQMDWMDSWRNKLKDFTFASSSASSSSSSSGPAASDPTLQPPAPAPAAASDDMAAGEGEATEATTTAATAAAEKGDTSDSNNINDGDALPTITTSDETMIMEKTVPAVRLAKEEIRFRLTKTCATLVEQLSQEEVISDTTEDVERLIDLVELILRYDVKPLMNFRHMMDSPKEQEEAGILDFLQEFTIKGNMALLRESQRATGPEFDMVRAWIVLGLNENSLATYFATWAENPKSVTSSRYTEAAPMSDKELLAAVCDQLRRIGELAFSLPLENCVRREGGGGGGGRERSTSTATAKGDDGGRERSKSASVKHASSESAHPHADQQHVVVAGVESSSSQAPKSPVATNHAEEKEVMLLQVEEVVVTKKKKAGKKPAKKSVTAKKSKEESIGSSAATISDNNASDESILTESSDPPAKEELLAPSQVQQRKYTDTSSVSSLEYPSEQTSKDDIPDVAVSPSDHSNVEVDNAAVSSATERGNASGSSTATTTAAVSSDDQNASTQPVQPVQPVQSRQPSHPNQPTWKPDVVFDAADSLDVLMSPSKQRFSMDASYHSMLQKYTRNVASTTTSALQQQQQQQQGPAQQTSATSSSAASIYSDSDEESPEGSMATTTATVTAASAPHQAASAPHQAASAPHAPPFAPVTVISTTANTASSQTQAPPSHSSHSSQSSPPNTVPRQPEPSQQQRQAANDRSASTDSSILSSLSSFGIPKLKDIEASVNSVLSTMGIPVQLDYASDATTASPDYEDLLKSGDEQLETDREISYTICPEVGLDSQDYKCFQCSRPVGIGAFGEGRLCDYTGKYYCTDCHLNEVSEIPARIVHNWDVRPRRVCHRSKLFLQRIEKLPVINLIDLNPKLINHVEELKEIVEYRQKLEIMREFVQSCPKERNELLKLLWPRDYLMETSCFTIQDLVEAKAGDLGQNIKRVVAYYRDHIVSRCLVCQQKGSYCSFCSKGGIIYPFDFDKIAKCPKCRSLSHRRCYNAEKCPKCLRQQAAAAATAQAKQTTNK